jgi:glycosyltransferase involved in cell wall biosynthesis
MACGTPVIGSAVGGIKSTVVDGRTGYLVQPGDPAGLADRLADLLQNPARARAFGRRAVRQANALYTWHGVSKSISNLYEEVLDECTANRLNVGVGRSGTAAFARLLANQ